MTIRTPSSRGAGAGAGRGGRGGRQSPPPERTPPRPRAGQPPRSRTGQPPVRSVPPPRTPGRTAPARTAPLHPVPPRRVAPPRRPPTARRPVRPVRRPPRRRLPLARPARRLGALLAVGVVLLAVLGLRLVQLQAFDSKAYAVRAEQQRLRTVQQPAQRGDITDRSGAVLATSVDARAVYADPAEVKDPQGTAAELAPLLHADPANLVDRLTRQNRFSYLAHDLTPAAARRVAELDLAGIGVLPERQRVYPGGKLAANLLGAVGADGTGLGGYEYALDHDLAGTDGKLTMQVGRTGTTIPAATETVRAAVPGSSVRLTVDRDLQWSAQRAITAQVRRLGALNGSVIVMVPGTGDVLAMATAPTFDPNHVGTADPAHMGNPPVGDVYEPGSVNKVITFSAALQERLVTPRTPITVPPTYRVAGHTFHDAEAHGTEHLTATGVLAKSSNIGTIEVAQRLGAQRLYRYLHAFGFGQPTGLRFPGEQPGVLPDPAAWSGTSLPTISFGQGISVNAMQVASVYATIANGGVRVPPRLVDGVVDPDGTLHPAPRPAPRRVVSARVARQVSDMLEAVTTNEGTAPAARIDGYRVAGKTGTAQRPNGKGGYTGYTSTFVGFAPADRPQLLVEVVLQLPHPRGPYFGGLAAAPVFHDVMSYALAERHVAPTGSSAPVARLTTR